MGLRRRIVREDWYWPTMKKIAENRFRKGQTKADLLLELDMRSRACCKQFGRDAISCQLCFRYRGWLDTSEEVKISAEEIKQ